ncbi:hypothetical protein CYMTET_44319 [Cymbomonas tetramitiformis]|uniref:Uncharacterized protein n=1 Tax=Cymbomonas tetramitiformis TaxID=36881 RepID=A0AAE0EZE2_9CHLO|nr:hypothetical protein CYMTET_44319 [Cymbomonas tetramitiformis]|eukprot:gene831-1308_t
MGNPFQSMTSGPAVNPSAPFPQGAPPDLYNRGSQPGMFWAQETIPQMYLHKVFASGRSDSRPEYTNLITEFWNDIYKNVRGDVNSNTPSWPIFVLTSSKISSTFDPSDVTNKDILKFRGMTGQFVTWYALNRYLQSTDDAARFLDHMQEFPTEDVEAVNTPADLVKILDKRDILKINFVGILKNIPTGGVGSSSVSMNVISGGRVTMVNHWGVNCMEGTRLYFLLVKGHRELKNRDGTREPLGLKLIPYANPFSNEQPAPGIPLAIEVKHRVPPRLRHIVLRVISVGRALQSTVDPRMNNRTHEIRKTVANEPYINFCSYLDVNIKSNLRNLGKVEIYVGI